MPEAQYATHHNMLKKKENPSTIIHHGVRVELLEKCEITFLQYVRGGLYLWISS